MGVLARVGKQEDDAPLLLQQMAQGSRSLPYATGTVHVESDDDLGRVVHLTFDEGRLVRRVVDDAAGEWAVVRPGPVDGEFSGEQVDSASLAQWSVRIGSERLVLPPLDDVASDALGDLREIPDADLALRFRLVGSPAGMVLLELAYVGGRRVRAEVVDFFGDDMEPVPFGSAEATCDITWRNYLRVRSGDLDPLEAGAEGTVEGHWTHLLLLHGLLQQADHVAAWSSLPELPEELAWFGEVAPWSSTGAEG
jgi:hypothetical protein